MSALTRTIGAYIYIFTVLPGMFAIGEAIGSSLTP